VPFIIPPGGVPDGIDPEGGDPDGAVPFIIPPGGVPEGMVLFVWLPSCIVACTAWVDDETEGVEDC